jgi:hypothetical protein
MAAGERPRLHTAKNTEASRRFAERRQREDEAPRLIAEVPALESLNLELSEWKGEAVGSTTYMRRIVVASAPAHFEIPCGDPSCTDGGHDLTYPVMRALRDHAAKSAGEDECRGNVRSSDCGRVLRYVGLATFRS